MKKNIEEYVLAYKKKYGLTPTVTWDKPWYRVGSSPGVNSTRFRQLISQLKY